MHLPKLVMSRYTTKAYNANKKISAEQMEQLQILLRFSPSSINSQPWHFVIASSDEGKAKIARATSGHYSGNEAKVLNASHVVVLCAREEMDDAYLQDILDQEEKDGRFKSAEAKAGTLKGRAFYVNLHRDWHDTQQWMEKQVYIALGSLLLGAAMLEIDATPIEGFDCEILDKELGLRQRGFKSVVMATLGYRSSDDPNADLPKSRFPEEDVFTFL